MDVYGIWTHFFAAFAKARGSPGVSSDSTVFEHTSKDIPDHLILDPRGGIARLEHELRRNKTLKVNDEAHSLSEKVEQLDRTFGESMWHNPSAPESKGLVIAAG